MIKIGITTKQVSLLPSALLIQDLELGISDRSRGEYGLGYWPLILMLLFGIRANSQRERSEWLGPAEGEGRRVQ